jgi:hypothetical protein
MVETVSSPNDRRAAAEKQTANGSCAQSGAISFAELVRAHDRWEREAPGREGDREDGRDEYHTRLEQFEAAEGEIVGAYWCTTAPSAVALTVKRRRLRREHPHIHRASDWVVPKNGEPIAELLHHCDTLAIRASEVLRGTAVRIIMQWIFAIESDLLGFIERSTGVLEPADVKAFYERVRNELLQVEHYYDQAGNKSARLRFFSGMLYGVVLLAAIGAGSGLLVWSSGVLDADAVTRRTIFICLAAGGVGAVVSVLTRMASQTRSGQDRFRLDYEVGRATSVLLGSFRPLLGGVFGVLLYALVRSKILQITPPTGSQAYYFFAVLAFLAGFNERWAHVMFGQAERTVGPALGKADDTTSTGGGTEGSA